jgi:hypothetical protein
MFRVCLTPLILILLVGGACQLRAQSSISLSVDLRDAPRKLLHTTEILPVRPGPLTLAFPEWIRNEHVPAPLTQQAGVFFTARNGEGANVQPIRWTRDPIDLYLYRVTIPTGVRSIEVRFDFITSDKDGGTPSSFTPTADPIRELPISPSRRRSSCQAVGIRPPRSKLWRGQWSRPVRS